MIHSKGWASRAFDVANHVLLGSLGILCILPLIHLTAVSLSDRAAATGLLVTFWPVRFTTVSYAMVLRAASFLSSFYVSVQRTVLGTALQMLLTVLTAYPLSKSSRELPGRIVFMWIVLFALLFSGGLIPWFLVIRKLKLLNTLWALVIPNSLPIWNVILMMNFFRSVPKDLEEAAIIDGASYWAVLYHVFIPISVPALATLTLFGAVGHWNSWFDGLILMMDRARMPLQTYLRQIVIKLDVSDFAIDQQGYFQFAPRTLRAAQTVVTIVPILVVYPFLQRYFISGIRLGAVKG